MGQFSKIVGRSSARALAFLLVGFLGNLTAQAMPAEIVILRHAEKPPIGNELSTRGWDRARALPALFSSRAELNQFGAPAEVIGMSQRPGHSIRSVQTVMYLSQSLNLRTNSDYRPGDVDQLVRDVSSDASLDGKTVVICWHRDNLPDLIEAFGGPSIGKVPSAQFDRLWLLKPSSGGMRMSNLPQNILPGDSTY